jgi:hypothetical protein
MKTIIGLFDNHDEAVSTIRDLKQRGVAPDDVSLVSNHADGWYADDSKAEHGAETGAGVGAVLGAVGGLLAGLGVLTIPGVGPVLTAGWLVSTLAGSATGVILGGAAGSLIGALTEHGVNEHDAHVYAESLKRGGTLVVVRAHEALIPAIEGILLKHRVDIGARRDELAAEGWTRFDDRAEPQALATAERGDPLRPNSPTY